jgi:hypothetical protein
VNAANRLGGLVVGLILLGAGVLAMLQTVALAAFDRDWPLPVLRWRQDLTTVRWSDTRMLLVGIGLGVLGLLILAAQLHRGRPRRLDTTWADGEESWSLRRSSVQRQAAAAARTVRGVDAARATTHGRRQDWQVDVSATTVGAVVDAREVQAAVLDELHSMGAPEDVPVTVRLRRTGTPE